LTLAAVESIRLALCQAAERRFGWSCLVLVVTLVLTCLIFSSVAYGDFFTIQKSANHDYSSHFVLFQPAFFGAALAAMTVALGCLLVPVAVAGLMLFQQVAWPLVSRLLYNFLRHHIVESKKTMYGLATALLLVAVRGRYSWQGLRSFVIGW
jgi:hypothetical protein